MKQNSKNQRMDTKKTLKTFLLITFFIGLSLSSLSPVPVAFSKFSSRTNVNIDNLDRLVDLSKVDYASFQIKSNEPSYDSIKIKYLGDEDLGAFSDYIVDANDKIELRTDQSQNSLIKPYAMIYNTKSQKCLVKAIGVLSKLELPNPMDEVSCLKSTLFIKNMDYNTLNIISLQPDYNKREFWYTDYAPNATEYKFKGRINQDLINIDKSVSVVFDAQSPSQFTFVIYNKIPDESIQYIHLSIITKGQLRHSKIPILDKKINNYQVLYFNIYFYSNYILTKGVYQNLENKFVITQRIDDFISTTPEIKVITTESTDAQEIFFGSI